MGNDFTTMLQQLFTTGYYGHMALGTLVLNILVVWIMVHFLYYRKSRRRDFYFTFMLLGVAIYFLVYSMIFVLEDMKGKTGIGIGIGLFGIFSIMRYRTDAMPVREMTYLFSIICLSVINALGCAIDFYEALIPNIVMLLAMFLCERFLLKKGLQSKLVQYDRIKLITPDKREELLADLRERLGLDITDVTVGSVDFLRDTALLRIYYNDKAEPADNHVSNVIKVKRDEWEDVK
ncbi:MAG: DUF4956 domain-containing protein [Muribaculaceae bacterium]|nr:DUF4956 domain-containing protein [Muribaculaceae bacterium]